MTTLRTVAFKELTATDEINARTKSKDGIDEMAASIAAKGLIQPLAVRNGDNGKFEVIDGRRRFMALHKLVKDGTLKKSYEVPVIIRNEDDSEALETSLAANTVRLPMHPCDQHEVFARLVGQGRALTDIAARFGISERTVKQHLALGNMAPIVRHAWRKSKIDADVAREFARALSHDVQEEAFVRLSKEFGNRIGVYNVKQALQGVRYLADDISPSVLAAYLAAGGTLTEDLFDDARFVDDEAKLRECADARIEELKQELLADGWGWVENETDLPVGWSWKWNHHDGVPDDMGELTPEEEARIRALEDDAANTTDIPEKARLLKEAWHIEYTAENRNIPPEIRAQCGIVLELMPKTFMIRLDEIGIVRPENASGDDAGAEADEFDESGEDDEDDFAGDAHDKTEDAAGDNPFAISDALSQTISEALTIAAAKALRDDTRLALRVITAALMTRQMSPASIRNDGLKLVRATGMHASFAEAFDVLMNKDGEDLGAAFCAAVGSTFDFTFNAWRFKSREPGIAAIVDALPAVAFLDAAREAFPAEDYFKRAHKETALAAIEEMREAGAGAGLAPEDVLAGMKKTDLAIAAAEQAKRCGWLPPELRHPAYSVAKAIDIAAE